MTYARLVQTVDGLARTALAGLVFVCLDIHYHRKERQRRLDGIRLSDPQRCSQELLRLRFQRHDTSHRNRLVCVSTDLCTRSSVLALAGSFGMCYNGPGYVNDEAAYGVS